MPGHSVGKIYFLKYHFWLMYWSGGPMFIDLKRMTWMSLTQGSPFVPESRCFSATPYTVLFGPVKVINICLSNLSSLDFSSGFSGFTKLCIAKAV